MCEHSPHSPCSPQLLDQASNSHNLLSKASLSPFLQNTQTDLESSPYKSKFPVLKFSPDKQSTADSPSKKLSGFKMSPVK